jgi:Matrixin
VLKIRSLKVILLSLLIAAGSLAALPPSASPQVDALPEIGLEELLDIANVDAPPLGTGLSIHADFPAEEPFILGGVPIHSFTATILPTGGVKMQHANTAQESTGTAAADECTDPTYLQSVATWRSGDMPIKWRFNKRSVPDGMNAFLAKRAMRKAHQVWPRAHTNCNENSDNAFRFNFKGVTGKRVAYDGINTVDFGRLGSNSLAVNYTWYSGGRILEVDMRLNKFDHPWTAKRQGPNRYVVRNVVAHELGHQLGLEDLSDPHGQLTMFSKIFKGEVGKTTLGKGDIRGADKVSP